MNQLRKVPRTAVMANRSAIVSLGKRLASARWDREIGSLIELLTSAGAWKEAVDLSAAVYEKIEDNTRNKPIRLHAKLRLIASNFEGCLSEGKLENVAQLRNDWLSTLADIETDNEVNRLRRDPLRGFLGSH
jgi:hypothetical protein